MPATQLGALFAVKTPMCILVTMGIEENLEEAATHWVRIAFKYDDEQKYDEAIESIETAIRIKPDYRGAYYFLAGIYHRLYKYLDEIAVYERLIRIIPDRVDTYADLWTIYYDIGHYEDAIMTCHLAIEKDPNYSLAYSWLGTLYSYCSIGTLPQAVDAYKQVIRLEPDDADAYFHMGEAYTELEQYPEAIEAYKEVIRLKPEYADAYNNLGVVYWFLNNKEASESQYNILKDLDTAMSERLYKLIFK